jgi:outer membrane protein OmpA-like peptidoglycan-associated protein
MFQGVAYVCVLLLAACSSTKELVVLLPGEDEKVGSITIEHAGHTVILDEPLVAAKIDTQGRVKKDAVTANEVEQTFASALAAHPPKPVHFRLYYDEANVEVTAESLSVLEALLAEVARRNVVEVEITGHTDRVGEVKDNDRLALERAQTVRTKLMQSGLHASFIRTVGRGEREPLVPTPDGQPEPKNRRVEIIVR